jgi:hypothetical protein
MNEKSPGNRGEQKGGRTLRTMKEGRTAKKYSETERQQSTLRNNLQLQSWFLQGEGKESRNFHPKVR